MRTVQLYINDKKVDLYGDEKIEITSSIQNIQDISKTFTDFSQTFTVPASDTNNTIFSWYYNNDVDGGFVAKERADARIEINHIPFRRGRVQLEGSEIKNNVPESYKITFYGDVVTLKDKFGIDKLSDLDWTDVNFAYTGTNVKNTITDSSDMDVRFPLISSSTVWTAGDGASTDISQSGNAIPFGDLFPAIRDSKIIERIKNKYSLTFNSNFFDSDYIKKSWTYWKAGETFFVASEPVNLLFDDSGTANSMIGVNEVNLTFDTVQGDVGGNGSTHKIQIAISTSPTCNYFIDVFKDGTQVQTIDSGSATSGTHTIVDNVSNLPSLNDTYTFKVRGYNISATTTITGTIYHTITAISEMDLGGGNITFVNSNTTFSASVTASSTVTTNLDFSTIAPDIKVSDWFAGILKQFNLVIYPTSSESNYVIEPLMDWYAHGGEVNITEYTDTASIKVDRPKLYKEISFEYEKSKAFLNTEFTDRTGLQYGNLKDTYNYDGGTFKVKLPFENMIFTKFSSSNSNLQVSYAVDKAVGGKSYVPKPVKLFMDELRNTNVSFYLHDGSSAQHIQQYMPFGQDQVFNTMDVTQNFGLEVSTLKDVEIPDTLFAMFYRDYLTNLFDNKTRKVKVKCLMPLPTLSMLTLDDSILLRDKRYLIDSMKTDLTTGEVELVLLSDWNREYLQTIGDYPPTVGSDASTLSIPISMVKAPNPTKQFDGGGGYVTLGATRETQFITFSLPVTYTTNRRVDITIPRNTTGSSRSQCIPVTYFDAAGNTIKTSNIIIKQEA
tara:strand:- start:46 stop:2385 length:2340 start_codon:yes stop_codon:yes gene_type:complete